MTRMNTEICWRSSVSTDVIIYPQMLDRCYTDFHLFQICLTSVDCIGPQADEGGEQQFSSIGQQLKENNFAPWMICEPNEVEGKKLLEEIMKGGNFGQYDTRDAALKKGGMMKHGVWKLKRVMRLVRSYPEEALWEPMFRVYYLGWRMLKGY